MPKIENSRVLIPIAVERYRNNPVVAELREQAATEEDKLNITINLINKSDGDNQNPNQTPQRNILSQYESEMMGELQGVFKVRLDSAVALVNGEVAALETISKPVESHSPSQRRGRGRYPSRKQIA